MSYNKVEPVSDTLDQQVSTLICESQLLSGGFESSIQQKFDPGINKENSSRKDVNACITALVIRELQKNTGLFSPAIISRAIDFLSSCASTSTKGVYNFYPPEHYAQSMGLPTTIKVPDDADDTSLITLLLFQTDRINRNSIIKTTCVELDKYRLHAGSNFDPPWFVAGAFYTWLVPGPNNMVDCCVNANIVALYASAALHHLRGYKEACLLISNAVAWCGKSVTRLASIIPFYADKQELYFAVEHAVSMGAVELASTLETLEWINPKNENFDLNRPICCSAYGKVTWHCSLLQQLRYVHYCDMSTIKI